MRYRWIRTANAYSSLGIVPDPIYTPMLRWRDYDLVNTIIHELVHATVWAKGYPEFNENFALFIGKRAALDFCIEKFGPNSEEVKYGIGSNYDDLLFQKYLSRLEEQLLSLYGRTDLTEEEKLKEREKIFAQTKIDFEKSWLPKMKTGDYQHWSRIELNNATIASRLVYYHDLSLYEKVYEKLGGDLARMVKFVKELIAKNRGDPEKLLQVWIEQNSSN